MRLSVQLIMVLMALNAVAAIFSGSGLASATGMTGPAESTDVNQLEDKVKEDRPQFGGGALQTLFGMYVTAVDFVNSIFGFLTAGPKLLKSTIFPAWFIDPLTGIMYFWIAGDVLYVATQRQL